MDELTDLQRELLSPPLNICGIRDVGQRASDEISRLREMLDTRIQACELRVDDKVILSINKTVSMEMAARLKQSFSNALGIRNSVAVLDDSISMSVLRPTEDDVRDIGDPDQFDDVDLLTTEQNREQRREKGWSWLRGAVPNA